MIAIDSLQTRTSWDSSKVYLDNYVKTLSESDTLKRVKAYIFYSRYYASKFMNDSTFKFLSKAQKLLPNQNSLQSHEINIELAAFYYDLGDYSKAENLIFKCLDSKNHEKLDNVRLHTAYGILGIIYCDLKDFETSLKYHRKALEVLDFRNPPQKFFVELAYNNIGYNLQQSGKLDESIKYFSMALNSDLSRDPILQSRVWDNLGYSFLKLNKFDASQKLFEQSLAMRSSANYVPGVIFSKLHLSELYLTKGAKSKSETFLRDAIQLAKKYHLAHEELHCLKYSQQKNYNLNYSQRIFRLTDSLQLAERRARNKFARIAFETDEITQEKDQAIQDKWLVISLASLALMLTLTLTIIIRQRAKQKELVFAREQEIANNSIYQLMHDQQAKINEGRQIEKRRIARELHDGVMNRLASTRLNLFILNKKKDEETINKCLPFINEIQGIEKEIRQVAHDLDNELFSSNVTFNTILEELFMKRNALGAYKIHPDITTDANWNAIDSALKINLYRIIQEAINNVEKHSDAKNLYVTLSREQRELKLVMHDDGKGFDTTRVRHGIGLKNITDRVAMSGGTVDIKSGKGKGTILTVSLPIKDVV